MDLPRGKTSGLRQAIDILDDVKGVKFSFFQSGDVVRHPVVQRIVRAYEAADKSTANQSVDNTEQIRRFH